MDVLARAKELLIGVITRPRIEREVALVVDLGLCLALISFPITLVKVVGVGYFLFRDGMAITGGQSFGKNIYDLRVVRSATKRRIGLRVSFLRNLLTLVPILNIIDLWYFIRDGKRLYDTWLGLEVVKDSVKKQISP